MAAEGVGRPGAISRDTLLHNLQAGELLPPGRMNEQEVELIGKEPAAAKATAVAGAKSGGAQA